MQIRGAKTFVDEVAAEPGGEKINQCIQCGVCSGSCSTVEWWEFPPRKIIALIRAGKKDAVLSSTSAFCCVSCYLCTVRCPRGIKPANLIHAVETIAEREGYKPRTPALALYRSFRKAMQNGRVWEFGMALQYYFSSNIFRALQDVPVALALLSRGRMSIIPPKRVKGGKDVKIILDKVKEVGGTL